jgi:hypothetical protein
VEKSPAMASGTPLTEGVDMWLEEKDLPQSTASGTGWVNGVSGRD